LKKISAGSVRKAFVFRKTETDFSKSPPHFKKNVTIVECCPGFLTVRDKCIPECKRTCVNSFCIGNNKCQCNSGYYAVDDFRCLPKCEKPCGLNMACLAPNKCVCKMDYKRANESYCEPVCSFQFGGDETFECINARCVAPNECECHEGYSKVSEFQCDATCKSCENGECIAPDVCECKDGFEKNSEGDCVPVCDPACINGDCVGPNECECHENFDKYLKGHECQEKQVIIDRQSCEKSCSNGICNDENAMKNAKTADASKTNAFATKATSSRKTLLNASRSVRLKTTMTAFRASASHHKHVNASMGTNF
jgi:hypothetical protein